MNTETATAPAQKQQRTLAPGTRVCIRDEEWLVQRVDRTSDQKQVLEVVGLSELVKDKEARFIADLEDDLGGGIEALSGPQIAEMQRRGGVYDQIAKQFAGTGLR